MKLCLPTGLEMKNTTPSLADGGDIVEVVDLKSVGQSPLASSTSIAPVQQRNVGVKIWAPKKDYFGSLFDEDEQKAVVMEVAKATVCSSDYDDKFSDGGFSDTESDVGDVDDMDELSDEEFSDTVSCGGDMDTPRYYGDEDDEGGSDDDGEVNTRGVKRTIARRSFQFTQMQKSMRRSCLLS
jgi:hypothetical protein